MKERLAAEASKHETAEKLAADLHESLLKVTENFDKAKAEFSQ